MVFLTISALSNRLRLKRSQCIILIFLFSLSLAVISFYFNPPRSWDIVRHSIWMNEIRTSGISLFDFVFNNKSGIGNAEYSNLYVFNFLRYIAVNISDNNFLLSAFCVFVNYMIIGWIIVDWEGLSEAKASISMTALLVLGAFSRVGAMFSNIRYPLASSLSVLAIYLYLCKKKPLYIYIILMALAMFVHPGVIMTIPIVVLSVFSFKNIIVEYISVFVITMLSNWISRLFDNAGNSYLQIIGRLYISYTSEEQYRGSRYGFYGSILIFIILSLKFTS